MLMLFILIFKQYIFLEMKKRVDTRFRVRIIIFDNQG